MFRALKNSINEHKKFSSDVKEFSTTKLFDQRDAAARCVCDFLIRGKIRTSISLLAQYVIMNREIQRRIDGV